MKLYYYAANGGFKEWMWVQHSLFRHFRHRIEWGQQTQNKNQITCMNNNFSSNR